MSATRRLLAEFRDQQRSQAKGTGSTDILLRPKADDQLFQWVAFIKGPPDSPFEAGWFQLRIQVPSDYPIRPPAIWFDTPVFHPNVHFTTGEICLDILKSEWSPVWTLESACRAVIALLSDPQADSPLNCDAGNVVRAGDLRGYHSLARYYTMESAILTTPSMDP